MPNNNRRRFFAIRAAIAKKAKIAETTVTFAGHSLKITPQNAALVEGLRNRDAEQAYEAAVFNRPYHSRLAAA